MRLEIAAAGENLRALRIIARRLISAAQQGDLQAIQQVADRIDGKPAQEQHVTVSSELDRMSVDELRELVRRELGAPEPRVIEHVPPPSVVN